MFAIGAFSAFLAVAAGAFGAHALRGRLSPGIPSSSKRGPVPHVPRARAPGRRMGLGPLAGAPRRCRGPALRRGNGSVFGKSLRARAHGDSLAWRRHAAPGSAPLRVGLPRIGRLALNWESGWKEVRDEKEDGIEKENRSGLKKAGPARKGNPPQSGKPPQRKKAARRPAKKRAGKKTATARKKPAAEGMPAKKRGARKARGSKKAVPRSRPYLEADQETTSADFDSREPPKNRGLGLESGGQSGDTEGLSAPRRGPRCRRTALPIPARARAPSEAPSSRSRRSWSPGPLRGRAANAEPPSSSGGRLLAPRFFAGRVFFAAGFFRAVAVFFSARFFAGRRAAFFFAADFLFGADFLFAAALLFSPERFSFRSRLLFHLELLPVRFPV